MAGPGSDNQRFRQRARLCRLCPLGRILGIKGYSTVTAHDVAVALDYLRGKPVCLVLLDLHLPDRDGHELLREMKADAGLAAIPVVVFSGDPGEAQDGAPAFVRKGTGLASGFTRTSSAAPTTPRAVTSPRSSVAGRTARPRRAQRSPAVCAMSPAPVPPPAASRS
jgi:CheY-like chemotaxis protein